ncbi:single-stranded DNA-binding protein [uncultured Granulicatella sp.]|uniref:single-stranded DNA-binding protein n=1 Tax=uncultured Granulicatella sp. TaxID=316089 RepID=UPI0028D039C9|nr:single-stranded DNA-binding protein [uncultured Granulicatella sp.]
MINNVVVTGRLTRAVDLRYTSNGTAFASFTLAVDRPFRNQNNEKETDFINCVMWRKPAENLANYTNKGSLIGVEGRIQTRNYEGGQGQRVYVTEVLAERFTFLESAKTANNDVYDNGRSNIQGMNKNQNSNGNFANSDPFTSNGDVFSVNDDDLPF